MNRIRILTAIALAGCSLASQAAIVPSAIMFDGYCDGVSGVTDLGGGLFTGTHDYSVCRANGYDYSDTTMVGPSGFHVLGMPSAIAGSENSVAQFGVVFTYVIGSDHNWYLISPDYGGIINGGTWTEGTAAANVAKARGLKPSSMK